MIEKFKENSSIENQSEIVNEKEKKGPPIEQTPYEDRFIMDDNERRWVEDDNFVEFGKELKREFEILISENSPLKEEFSPKEELQMIKKMPKVERRAALSIFKNKLERQREGWANCRIFLEKIIEFDNNPPRDYLLEWIHLFGKNYGFAEEHYELTEKIIDVFYEERGDCQDFLKEFKEPYQILNELAGTKFKNSKGIEVNPGPISVDVTVDSEIYKKITKNKNINVSSGSGGFSSSGLFAGIFYNVIKRIQEEDKIKIHEREHSKNNLLFDFFHPEKNDIPVKRHCLEIQLGKEKDEEKKDKIFKKYLKAAQEEGLLSAKHEILAYKKDGSNLNSSIFFEYPSYDYFKNIREKYPNKSKMIDEILIEDYRRILDEAIAAFNALEKRGYTTDQVISLLTDKRLVEWRKTVRRIIEQRR